MAFGRTIVIALIVSLAAGAPFASAQALSPFEADHWVTPPNVVDEHITAALAQHGLELANPCSDEVFIRRVYLDVIGTLPEPAEVQQFLEDGRLEKRSELIDRLLARDEFADYWALKWCDVLRVKSEFPINLWPNAVQAYHRWVRDAIANNKPYDQFARELLTSSGSNFRVPPANFYRAAAGHEPSALAAVVALTFMGSRVDTWPEKQRHNLEAFFSRLAFKSTGEWKEEIIYLDPAPRGPLDAVLPDGSSVRIEAGEDPRKVFADWLISAENPWFARAVVNRTWFWLMGRGIIHEPDDIRPDNPPSNPELLAVLERELLRAEFDLRAVYRLILRSRTYQQSSIARRDCPEAETLFAYYPVRRLDAEVLVDALCQVFGGPGESYTSAIPEPFTVIPKDQRTITLADGSITSPFLELFGRPPRDTGLMSERNNQPTRAQRLHLINSSHVQKKIENSPRLRKIVADNRKDRRKLISAIYMHLLSRSPTPEELDIAEEYFKTAGLLQRQAVDDLAWALINTKEFFYRH
ncbi:MAG: DUF1553 domain-containing protein [Phycisphaerae bacterium]|nr:DUF1553 domain-containing protein [Phycisphaerae bacterium]